VPKKKKKKTDDGDDEDKVSLSTDFPDLSSHLVSNASVIPMSWPLDLLGGPFPGGCEEGKEGEEEGEEGEAMKASAYRMLIREDIIL
jgi:hypothetical protein